MSIKPCDQDVFDKGQSVCLVDIPKETAENICRSLSAATGCKIDWHYIGGRVHIKALAAPVVERQPVVMSFDFEHPFSCEKRTVSLTKQDVFDGMEDFFYDKLGEQICQCESVGETNVVDCSCDEYVHDFEIVAACLDKVKELNQ